ncbi:MAG TPA: recombination protein NinG [Niabella sp.]|nr:recombination protein NinG [Niabella sp.]
MNRSPKPRKCPQCLSEFTPKRIGLRLTKTCGNPACELDAAQNVQPKLPKIKLKKPKKASALKKELWEVFSLHQKLVHSVDGEWCQCYTCDKPIKIGDSGCQGGHCLSKAANGNIYFDERAVRPQCYRCNVNLGGMHYEFNEKLKQEIGIQAWQDMYDNRKAVVKKNADWYIDKIQYYKAEIERLKNVKFCK